MGFANDYLKGFAVVFTLFMTWLMFHYYVATYFSWTTTNELIVLSITLLLPFIIGTIIREGRRGRFK